MSDPFPQTPVTLLSLLEMGKDGASSQEAWKTFFDLYHEPIRLAALGSFKKFGWVQVSEDLLDEVLADVVVSFFKAEFSYDPSRGKLRNYLRQLIRWRIMDRLGKLPPSAPAQLESVKESELVAGSEPPDGELAAKEQAAYRASLLVTMLEDVRTRVSPQTFLFFELTKMQGESPEEVALRFKVKRNVVDNAAHRVLNKLRDLAACPEYRKEYEA